MEKISRFLQTKVTALSILTNAFLNMALGIIIIYHKQFFINSASFIFLAYFAIRFLFESADIFFALPKGIKRLAKEFIQAVLSFVLLVFVCMNIGKIWTIIPIIMALWAIFTALAAYVSFFQYRKEKSTAPFRYFLSGTINLCFGLWFIKNIYDAIPVSLNVIAVYMILMGLSACGLDSIAAGIITPGTYYDYLNNEFKRKGSRVVKRTVYYKK